jgi:hypothetical protein
MLVIVAAAGFVAGPAGAATCGLTSPVAGHRTHAHVAQPARDSWSDAVRLVRESRVARVNASASGGESGGRRSLALLLLAFVLTFILTRLYTRRARAFGGGGLTIDGVHVHHLVVGIVLALVSALLTIALEPTGPARDILGIAFGIGAALTLDEFALWYYLRDVYWSSEGRSSIRATMLGLLLAALVLVGRPPLVAGAAEGLPTAAAALLMALNIVLSLMALLKGKPALALVSVFVPAVGLLAAARLAKPGSPWARCLYVRNLRKAARAQARHGGGSRFERVQRTIADLVGGRHGPATPAVP